MPPDVPPVKWAHTIEEDKILSFFEVDQASRALKDVDFSIKEEIGTLVQLFRDTDPQVSLRAHTQLRKVLKDIADAGGLITKQEFTATNKETGNSVRLTRNAARLASSLQEISIEKAFQDKPDYAAEYLPSSDSRTENDLESDEGNGTNGTNEIRGSDTLRLSDQTD